MDLIELKNYAFTVQIPAFKKVNYDDLYLPYNTLSQHAQEDFIYKSVRSATSDLDISFEIKFEKHKDGRVHAHGTLHNITSEQLIDFKNSIGYLIGIKSQKQINDCCYCIPILCSYNQKIWNEYCNKESSGLTPSDSNGLAPEEKDYSKYLFGKI